MDDQPRLCLGHVMHRRLRPAVNAFVYPVFYVQLPLRHLAASTQAVAAGQFDKQLARAGSDELGFLVESFNQMTRKLAQARDIAQRSQELLESRRDPLPLALRAIEFGAYAALAMLIHALIAIPAMITRVITDIGLGYSFIQAIQPTRRTDLY